MALALTDPRAYSTSHGESQGQSSGQGTSQSGSYIPDYAESPLLRSIAQYAFDQAPQVYQWGMEQYNKNQGDIDSLLRDALQYASPQRIAADMGMAEAGVQQGAEAGRLSAIRDLESFGIDPSSGRYAQLDAANRVMAGASAAGAGNQQRMADQAAGNAMRNQAISASLQNTQLGYEAAKAMQGLLATGMQLKYPPLGNQSVSQNTQQSTNVSQQDSESRGPAPAGPGGGGNKSPSGGEGGGEKPQQGGGGGGGSDRQGRPPAAPKPTKPPPKLREPPKKTAGEEPKPPPEDPSGGGDPTKTEGDQGPDPASAGWTWDPETQTWMPPSANDPNQPGATPEQGTWVQDEDGNWVWQPSNEGATETLTQGGYTLDDEGNQVPLIGIDPATGTYLPPGETASNETVGADLTDLPSPTTETGPSIEGGAGVQVTEDTEGPAYQVASSEGDLSGLGQQDPNVLAEAQNIDPNTGYPYGQEGDTGDPAGTGSYDWGAQDEGEDWQSQQNGYDQENQDWESQQNQDWQDQQDQYDQQNQDWESQQEQDWQSQQDEFDQQNQDWQDQQDEFDQQNQDWESQQEQDWQDQQDQYDQQNQDWEDQQNQEEQDFGGDSGDEGDGEDYGYQRGGQVRRRPMPMQTGYRPMAPRPMTSPRQMTPPRPTAPRPMPPVPNRQFNPMTAQQPQVPPQLGALNGQPPYPQPLPGGMQRGGRVRPRPPRTPAAQPTTGGFVSRELSPSRGQQTDDVQARLNAGEFVIPKDVAHWKGKEFFHKLIQQARKARGAGPNGQPNGRPNGQMRTGYGAQR